MKKNKINLFDNLSLDKEEKRIEDALSKGEFVGSGNLEGTRDIFKKAVKNYENLQKTKPITIRINQADLIKVKSKAKRSGIRYQTLLSALIRQYAEGRMKLEL